VFTFLHRLLHSVHYLQNCGANAALELLQFISVHTAGTEHVLRVVLGCQRSA